MEKEPIPVIIYQRLEVDILRLKLQLPAKAGQLRISECEAIRMLTLPANDFQAFLNWPQEEKIRDIPPPYYDEDGKRVYRGILILGENREDGVFVYDAGEHFVYLPGARAVVDSILAQAVEKIIKEGTENTNEGNWSYYFSELYEQMRLVVESGNGFDTILLEKLAQRPEVAEITITDECFDIRYYLNYCKNLASEYLTPSLSTGQKNDIKIAQDQIDLLSQLEEFRKRHESKSEPSDWAIRMCQAIVAHSLGFTDRNQWTDLLKKQGETLFNFEWTEGSVSDHVIRWCKETGRDWRYSHLGELQVASGGEWRRIDYECGEHAQTRVFLAPKLLPEQELKALAQEPAIQLRDLLELGLPEHDVYLVHTTADVGWVPAADLTQLSDRGKEQFAELLDAKVSAVRPGPYGTELVLDGVDPQLLVQYDQAIADCAKAESAMKLFM